MAGTDGFVNPEAELDLLHDLNGLADRLPGWAGDGVALAGQAVLPALLGVLILAAWLRVRRRPDAAPAVAGVAWALLAAGIAYAVNAPIRGFVARPRPFADHPDLHVLGPAPGGYSFVSDHAGVAMAVAVALFLVHRALGAAAFGLALLVGLSRVMAGAHYPSDVLGGFALGAAVALLLAPPAQAALTRLALACAARRRLSWLVRPSAEKPPLPERGLAA
ncbi:phosphatase PAP2 family protein [Streptomyces sp. DSM 44917]|uniref:Phosphatase PAP2 family protein n=1 Tax=Streptomyces boetiae TaxID=3075541 RepID=A0ABU2L201_9ACTN|nr:phosphatase PAP2 family protein [Streptomyces sp. DSM 44917]MDT0305586.1 phosphatase PAP2 family protein [Streptomyces sp. DSM 44917]